MLQHPFASTSKSFFNQNCKDFSQIYLRGFSIELVRNTIKMNWDPNAFTDDEKLIRDWRGIYILHPGFNEINVLDVEMIGELSFQGPLVYILRGNNGASTVKAINIPFCPIEE